MLFFSPREAGSSRCRWISSYRAADLQLGHTIQVPLTIRSKLQGREMKTKFRADEPALQQIPHILKFHCHFLTIIHFTTKLMFKLCFQGWRSHIWKVNVYIIFQCTFTFRFKCNKNRWKHFAIHFCTSTSDNNAHAPPLPNHLLFKCKEKPDLMVEFEVGFICNVRTKHGDGKKIPLLGLLMQRLISPESNTCRGHTHTQQIKNLRNTRLHADL